MDKKQTDHFFDQFQVSSKDDNSLIIPRRKSYLKLAVSVFSSKIISD